jgi:hypothetical protein
LAAGLPAAPAAMPAGHCSRGTNHGTLGVGWAALPGVDVYEVRPRSGASEGTLTTK